MRQDRASAIAPVRTPCCGSIRIWLRRSTQAPGESPKSLRGHWSKADTTRGKYASVPQQTLRDQGHEPRDISAKGEIAEGDD
jgi:hypothetical protein